LTTEALAHTNLTSNGRKGSCSAPWIKPRPTSHEVGGFAVLPFGRRWSISHRRSSLMTRYHFLEPCSLVKDPGSPLWAATTGRHLADAGPEGVRRDGFGR